MVVLNWTSTTYPTTIDGTHDVMTSHPMSLASAVYALETKIGITNAALTGVGGLSFYYTGKAANPGALGNPTLWVDNSGGSPFPLMYTDDAGTDYNLTASLSGGFYGYGLTHGGLAIGDLVYISAANTVSRADAVTGHPAHAVIIAVAGASCTVAYGSEITVGAWSLTPGATYYLTTSGAFGTAPPGSATIQQEVGFARNTTTLVFRPTLVTGV
jgi:hypothetical protein